MNQNTLIAILAVLIVGGGTYYVLTKTDTGTNTNDTINQMPITSGENPAPGSIVHDQPVEPAAAKARADLAAKLGVEEKGIVIMLVEDATWNNGCLGLAKPDEFCTQALVPGFKVEMLAQGKTYVYRTDKTGASVRAQTN